MPARLVLDGGPLPGVELAWGTDEYQGDERTWPPPEWLDLRIPTDDGHKLARYHRVYYDDVPASLGQHPNLLITARYHHVSTFDPRSN